MYGSGVMPGWRAGSGVGYGILLRAQNRAAKGSTLLRRRSTLPIWLYYNSKACSPAIKPAGEKQEGEAGSGLKKTTLPARKSSQRSTLNGRFQYYYILKTIDFADNYSEKVHNICAPGQLSKNVSNFCLLETLIHLIFEILELVQTLYTVNTFAMGYENVFTLFRKNTLSVNKKIKFLIPNT